MYYRGYQMKMLLQLAHFMFRSELESPATPPRQAARDAHPAQTAPTACLLHSRGMSIAGSTAGEAATAVQPIEEAAGETMHGMLAACRERTKPYPEGYLHLKEAGFLRESIALLESGSFYRSGARNMTIARPRFPLPRTAVFWSCRSPDSLVQNMRPLYVQNNSDSIQALLQGCKRQIPN